MSQATTFGCPLVSPANPTPYSAQIDDSLDALLSSHSGASRPAYAVAGTVWLKTISAGLAELYFFDGTDDILLGKAHMGANVWGPASQHFPHNRPKYRWKDADEVYVGPGSYRHVGTVDQLVYWAEELTFAFGAGGSNAASDALGNNEWQYLYLDDSAIVTAASPIITAAQLVASTTAPAWSAAKKGRYNGNDRCIGAFLTGGSANILEFIHDGGNRIDYADAIVEASGITPSNTWTDVNCASSVPAFSTRASAMIHGRYVDTAGVGIQHRTNGQTGATGRSAGGVTDSATYSYVIADVFLDSSQIFELRWSSATAGNTVFVEINGWYFPAGI